MEHIPNAVQKLVNGNAGAPDLQQATPMAKQVMCEHTADAASYEGGDAGAASSQFLNHVRYTTPTDGVIVGTDHKHEWLLSWWWSHYSKHNNYPVTFADFGMSHLAREWCAARGSVLKLQRSALPSQEALDPKNVKNWTEVFGDVMWQSRASWFMKPHALAQTPYQRTIWIDLDCEILCPLWPLFETCECPSGVAMVQESEAIQRQELERGILLPGETTYNSGLIVFKKGAPIIQKWAQQALTPNEFSGDQHLLCRLLFLEKIQVHELSPDYNWRVCRGLNVNAKVIHWVGSWGKQFIRRFGGYQEFIQLSAKK